MIHAVFVGLIALLPAQTSPDAAKLTAAHDHAQACAKASVNGDFETVAEFTHPLAIQAEGGRDAMIKILKETTAEQKKNKIHLLSSTVSAPDAIHAIDSDLYVIVHVTRIVQVQDEKFKFKSYMLGHSSDDGKSWKFIDGQPGEPELRKLLPHLPKGLRFPNKEKPQKLPAGSKK